MKLYDAYVATERVTVSLETDLAAAIREAAEADHENVSAWIAMAARRLLTARGLRQVVEEWERTHGAFTDDEITEARRRLGW